MKNIIGKFFVSIILLISAISVASFAAVLIVQLELFNGGLKFWWIVLSCTIAATACFFSMIQIIRDDTGIKRIK